MKRLLSISLTCLLATFAAAQAKDFPQIDYVKSRHVEAETFKRISEYFDGKENQGDKIVLRTDPSVREGWYLVLMLDGDADQYPAGTRVGLKVLLPGQKEEVVKATSLPTPIPSSSEIWIGLTGKDEPANGKPPVAWMVVIYSPQGKVYSAYKSYLWEKPDEEAKPAQQ
ncbi:hypothetical protein H5P28_17540 [Ruficoccus amylovorans]|uniref:Uncharacterized protein n=1 Tax=Ruficoccus amylovorans TaxID=1804625 RepID=A0A842HK80_9BACT|nr:hypothetical protein [Ruficoccus amylovorans]MBC2596074.1 hypothetical protein [Ruficoccus amylovorans]